MQVLNVSNPTLNLWRRGVMRKAGLPLCGKLPGTPQFPPEKVQDVLTSSATSLKNGLKVPLMAE